GGGLWQRRFGADPGVVGRTVDVNGTLRTVVGVLPAGFQLPTDFRAGGATQVYLPGAVDLDPGLPVPPFGGSHGSQVVGRLAPGVTVEAARAELERLADRLAAEGVYPEAWSFQPRVFGIEADVLRSARPALLVLLAAVGLVLLIACGNVANLLLARAAGRQKEIAVRRALGAPRGRLIRQLLTESVLLAGLGAILGMVLAYWGVRGLVASLPANVPRADEIRVDGIVLAFTAALAVFTGLLFGIAPAWKISSGGVQKALREEGRGTVGPAHHRLRNTLVVTEIALALVLLVGAGLLVRSFARVLGADAGFRPEGVLTASLPLPQGRFPEGNQRAAFVRQVVERVQAVPGVQAASAALPLLGGWQSSFTLEGRPEPPAGQLPSADITRVTPAYFRAMGVRVLEGRAFSERDTAEAPPVAIVDETFVRTHYPGESALGKRFRFGSSRSSGEQKVLWPEIVGVVGHVKNYGVDQDSRVEVYLPYDQSPVSGATLIVRAERDPAALSSAVREAVKAVDPEVPVYSIRTLEELVSDRTAERRLAVMLITVFAAVALLLAGVGIYGVMSYAVAQRTQEIGIRMALGAERRDILRMVLRHGSLMAVTGVVVGLAAALALARLITSLLFQVSATDPPTFSTVPVVLIGVALLACYIPARRATRVDPLVALRDQ
ncbi:MAG TPA: ABC transporter permease, partial [Vicinamibacteria bacterium]|nr:ABC transporter permease [Vicinamibacteria bacterium]